MAAILNFLILLRLFIIQHFKFILDIILYVYVIHNNPWITFPYYNYI